MPAELPGGLPAPVPYVSPDAEPYWRAAAQGRLILLRCDTCSTVIWYPRPFCPGCAGSSLTWEDAAGTGAVYSFTITRRGQGAYREAGPYVLAYVELDEGPRMLTNIVECDVDDVRVGQRVTAVFHASGKGTALPRFRPLAHDGAGDAAGAPASG
jgi:uncharacterized OB-fold protein